MKIQSKCLDVVRENSVTDELKKEVVNVLYTCENTKRLEGDADGK